jgi:hypothetical protein
MNSITYQQSLDLITNLKTKNSIINIMSDEEGLKLLSTTMQRILNSITYVESLQIIDQAAIDNKLYHHNGGQAYVRLDMNLDILMVIDHTTANRTRISLHDGSQYFIDYAGYNIEHSRRLRDQSTTMVEWYTRHNQLVEMDRV